MPIIKYFPRPGPCDPYVPGAVTDEAALPSLSWDNYHDQPVFELELQQRRIEIVSTDYSELESSQGSFHIGPRPQPQTKQQKQIEDCADTVFGEEESVEVNSVAGTSTGTGGSSPTAFSDRTMAQQVAARLEELRQEMIDLMDDLPAQNIVAGSCYKRTGHILMWLKVVINRIFVNKECKCGHNFLWNGNNFFFISGNIQLC